MPRRKLAKGVRGVRGPAGNCERSGLQYWADMSNEPPIRGDGAPIVAYVSLGAAEGKVGPRPKDPPDRFEKLLKVGELGVRIGQLGVRFLELVDKLDLWNRCRWPTGYCQVLWMRGKSRAPSSPDPVA